MDLTQTPLTSIRIRHFDSTGQLISDETISFEATPENDESPR